MNTLGATFSATFIPDEHDDDLISDNPWAFCTGGLSDWPYLFYTLTHAGLISVQGATPFAPRWAIKLFYTLTPLASMYKERVLSIARRDREFRSAIEAIAALPRSEIRLDFLVDFISRHDK